MEALTSPTCSVSTGLRLRPETAKPLGLNPFHLALTDTTFSSLAVQGHVRRAQAGDTGLALQQDLELFRQERANFAEAIAFLRQLLGVEAWERAEAEVSRASAGGGYS